MHIEPGVVDGAKLLLSYGTAAGALGLACKMAVDTAKKDGGVTSLALRTAITTPLVFSFFELLPHFPVGVSEVHFIFGSTLFLMFGAGAAALGLVFGLLLQGLLLAPFDLPQYGMNITTLILPLFAMAMLAKKIVPANTAYKDVGYMQALKLSTTYQGGIVAWVAFWAFYGHGFSAESFAQITSFGAAYMMVILIEPLADLAVLAGTKTLAGAGTEMQESRFFSGRLFSGRLHQAAA